MNRPNPPPGRPSWAVSGWSRWAGAAVGYARRADLYVVLGMLAAVSLGWIFVALAEEVLEGDTQTFDEAVLIALRNPADHADPIGPGWLEEAVRDLSALGGFAVLLLIVVSGAGYLLLQGRRATALLLIATTATGTALSSALKIGFGRPRPDLVAHATEVYTLSFPSGHSTMSAAVYLTLGVILARAHTGLHARLYFVVLAVLLTVLVGASRVYLGVHWPTDVLAGWTVGAGWAVLVWLVAWYLQRSRRIERAGGVER